MQVTPMFLASVRLQLASASSGLQLYPQLSQLGKTSDTNTHTDTHTQNTRCVCVSLLVAKARPGACLVLCCDRNRNA
uniref:Putative secreted protein n=1 Tax=Anopheles darlingi TaxID=43151 RepID=A0A2M4DK06_ANODA